MGIKVVEQSFEIISMSRSPLKQIEAAARTCYKSEDKIRGDSDREIVKFLLRKGHSAMIEFADAHVLFKTNRGVSHEMVRHRPCSFAQESTRYVRYSGDVEFIKPVWADQSTIAQMERWKSSCERSAEDYQNLLSLGWAPEKARDVLNHALKTEINVKANLREWRHIFRLRLSKSAHPQYRDLMEKLLPVFKINIPIVFDDIEVCKKGV